MVQSLESNIGEFMSTETRHKRYLKTRINKATRILKLFYDKHDIRSSAADVIADVMHLADKNGWYIDDMVASAKAHWQAEHDCDDLTEDAGNLQAYDEYYSDCERANKIPLTFENWSAKN